ncbi:MAG: hypothetical protein K0R17_2006 [Rariglobus sp.]|jgi:hypothetical protein|nr:hypothetical protein [Rariglobus sp.]
MNTRVLLTLIAVAFLSPAARALEFRLLSWAGTIEDLNYANGQKPVAVVAREGSLSPKYQFTGAGPLVLFREIQRDGKTVREPVASLTPPVGFTHAILMLAATDTAGTAYTARWINDSPEVRKSQTITYENLSSLPVAIKLGQEELALEPDAKLTRPTNPDVYRLALKVAARTQNGWEMVISSSQPVRRGLRTLVIIRDGRENPYGPKEPVECLAFNDIPPLPPPPGPSVAGR